MYVHKHCAAYALYCTVLKCTSKKMKNNRFQALKSMCSVHLRMKFDALFSKARINERQKETDIFSWRNNLSNPKADRSIVR